MAEYANPNGRAAGQAAEQTNSTTGPAGVYVHPVTGVEVITTWDPLFGDAQSEGAIRVGFIRKSDTPEGAVHYVGEVPATPTTDASTAAINRLADVLSGATTLSAPSVPVTVPTSLDAPLNIGTLDGTPASTGVTAPIDAITAPVAPVEQPVETTTVPETPVVVDAPVVPETPVEETPAEETTETPAIEQTETPLVPATPAE